MANNHVRGKIEAWDAVAGADIYSGDVVEMGEVTGVALTDIANGATGAVAITGTFALPKGGATPFAQGAEVEWNGTIIVAKAAGKTVGFVSDAAVASAASVNVRLERR